GTALLPNHVRQHALGKPLSPHQRNPKALLPFVVRGLAGVVPGAGEVGRVVAQNINATVSFGSRLDHMGHLVGFRNIAQEERGISSGPAKLGRRHVARLGVQRTHENRRAFLGVDLRDGAADAVGGAGDDGDSVLQSGHGGDETASPGCLKGKRTERYLTFLAVWSMPFWCSTRCVTTPAGSWTNVSCASTIVKK